MKHVLILSLGLALVTFACQSNGGESDSNMAAGPGDLRESLGGPSLGEDENWKEFPDTVEDHGHAHGGHGHTGDANELMNQEAFKDLVSFFESPDRAEWQRPDELIASLGELEGKKVMDLGAGTGYFAFRLLDKGADIVAAEVDDRFIAYLQNKRDTLDLADEVFEVRKVFYDDPLASEGEFDVFFTVDTYHHIEDRPKYLKKVFSGVKPGGKFFVVDFKREETPHGPPLNIRVMADRIVKELQDAGFIDVTLDGELLPEQNVVTGFRPG